MMNSGKFEGWDLCDVLELGPEKMGWVQQGFATELGIVMKEWIFRRRRSKLTLPQTPRHHTYQKNSNSYHTLLWTTESACRCPWSFLLSKPRSKFMICAAAGFYSQWSFFCSGINGWRLVIKLRNIDDFYDNLSPAPKGGNPGGKLWQGVLYNVELDQI